MFGNPAESGRSIPSAALGIKLRPYEDGTGGSWVGHVLGADEDVEFFGGEEAKLDGGFAEADAGAKGGFGDLGGVVVADLGRERGDEHK